MCIRDSLYERIDHRVDLMLEAGLVKEVKRLRAQGCHKGMVSMQGLGYKEIPVSYTHLDVYKRQVCRF